MNEEQKSTIGVIGVGVGACAVCCAGPIVAAAGGLSTLGPVAAGGALLVAGAGYVRRQRRRPVEEHVGEPERRDVA